MKARRSQKRLTGRCWSGCNALTGFSLWRKSEEPKCSQDEKRSPPEGCGSQCNQCEIIFGYIDTLRKHMRVVIAGFKSK